MKKTLIISFLLSLILTSAVHGETKKIRVVHTDWFPYTYEENNKSLGFEIEIFKEVMKKMNIEVEFINYPWKRCLYLLEKGSADALISLLKTPERKKYTYFPDTHISISKTIFFTKKNKNISFNGSYEDLKNYKIGVILGFSYGEAFDNADYLKKERAINTHMLIKKILGGREDLGAENQAVVTATAAKMGVKEKIKIIEPPIHTQKLYVGFSKAKGLKKLCDEYSKSLSEFKTTERYNSILQKYGITAAEME